MLEIGLGVGFFTGIVVLLALVILSVRSCLIAKGDVTLIINDTETAAAPCGCNLLDALNTQGVHLPSACGGVGTCGQCRVQVLEGGGDLLPTERSRISRREAKEGTRLACQVKVQNDLRIRVPEEVFGVREWQCTVRSNDNIASMIKELVLDLPAGETIDFRAGGYIQITCPPYQADFRSFDIAADYQGEWDRFDLWRYRAGTKKPVTRAYSMANYPAENDVIMLNVRIAVPPPTAAEGVPPGVVSSYLFNLKPGDTVSVSGPYGHFFASETDAEMIFIGGGVGMAPMRSHIFDQLKRLDSKRPMSFWYGARNKREMLYAEDFNALQAEHENFRWTVALSEPEPGDEADTKTGFIHDALRKLYLENHPAPEECEYYLCGPPMMIKATLRMLDNLGVDPDNIFFDDFGV